MDIQVASNFERALFEACGRDADWVAHGDGRIRAGPDELVLPPAVLAALRARYSAVAVDDVRTLATIAAVHQIERTADRPAHGRGAGRGPGYPAPRARGPVVVLSTAHPAKFPDAVRQATGTEPPLPPRLKGLYEGVERVTVLGHDLAKVRAFIASDWRSGHA